MDSEFEYKLPISIHVEFSRVIQEVTEENGSEISFRAIWENFNNDKVVNNNRRKEHTI